MLQLQAQSLIYPYNQNKLRNKMFAKEQDSSMDKRTYSPIQVKTNSSGAFKVVTIPKVYWAGKMEKSLKRYGLVNFTLTHSEKRRPKAAPHRKFTVERQNYIYTGPYIIACHPQCPKDLCRQEQLKPTEIKIETSKNDVLRALQGIQQADYVLVWLEDNDCYNAITEIGYAFALKKKIFIACERKAHENYSFAFKMANKDRLVDNRNKGINWLFAQVVREQKNKVQTVQAKPIQDKQDQVQPEVPQNQVQPEVPKTNKLVCHGCIGKSWLCQLQKNKIKHCYRCGLQDYYTQNCIRCHSKQVKIISCWKCGLQDYYSSNCPRCPNKKVKE